MVLGKVVPPCKNVYSNKKGFHMPYFWIEDLGYKINLVTINARHFIFRKKFFLNKYWIILVGEAGWGFKQTLRTLIPYIVHLFKNEGTFENIYPLIFKYATSDLRTHASYWADVPLRTNCQLTLDWICDFYFLFFLIKRKRILSPRRSFLKLMTGK